MKGKKYEIRTKANESLRKKRKNPINCEIMFTQVKKLAEANQEINIWMPWIK
jgi:hypothetical protein